MDLASRFITSLAQWADTAMQTQAQANNRVSQAAPKAIRLKGTSSSPQSHKSTHAMHKAAKCKACMPKDAQHCKLPAMQHKMQLHDAIEALLQLTCSSKRR